ncbi:hypothetical protein BT93_C0797 [Corymbia citriodora subsp. variegata]|nr:hypothetical protein BT93_C0797 [Corymbia citriodora subsp. variegata]
MITWTFDTREFNVHYVNVEKMVTMVTEECDVHYVEETQRYAAFLSLGSSHSFSQKHGTERDVGIEREDRRGARRENRGRATTVDCSPSKERVERRQKSPFPNTRQSSSWSQIREKRTLEAHSPLQVDNQDDKMPRVEDIAWKFVIRQGKKWRCPYCRHEASGAVTRVKSHFLKQPNKGITTCTEVPEHIRELMELLDKNQVHDKDNIAWKFIDRLGENRWRCHHCRKGFSGDLRRAKGHLLGVPIEGIPICTQVPDHVRKLMQSLLDEVGEEQSRDAHGPSSMEPPSRDMPTQAEEAERESGEANRQFPMEPRSRDTRPPAVHWSPGSFVDTENLFSIAGWGTGMEGSTSDQDRQFQDASVMPSQAQSGQGMFM